MPVDLQAYILSWTNEQEFKKDVEKLMWWRQVMDVPSPYIYRGQRIPGRAIGEYLDLALTPRPLMLLVESGVPFDVAWKSVLPFRERGPEYPRICNRY